MEILEGFGTIVEKSEGVDKNNKKYWKFKIRCEDGNEKTFGLFEYDAGLAVSVNQEVFMTWKESEGQGKHGVVTYRNLNSIGSPSQYKKDPVLAKKTDKQIAEQAPPESLKEVVHEGSGRGGSPTTFNQGARVGMVFNNAVALAIAENKNTKEEIEKNYKYLKELLDKLER